MRVAYFLHDLIDNKDYCESCLLTKDELLCNHFCDSEVAVFLADR